MKNLKKLLSMLLVIVMMMGLATGCAFDEGDGDQQSNKNDDWENVGEDGLPLLTEEKIELTYFNFDSEVLTQKLAEKFMELHDNITVNVVYVPAGEANDTLMNMISNGEVPDCFMFTDCDFPLANELLLDITDYWEADKENQNLLPTINEAKLGYFGTDKKWATPMKFFPGVIFIDKTLMAELNIEMPDVDWTWSEMIDLIKEATRGEGTEKIYGLGVYNRLDSYYGIAASQDIIGEFGYDGTKFDLSAWAVGEQEFADLKLGGYVAPDRETQAMENWLGDWEGWAGASGKVAIMTEAYWTYLNLFDTDYYRNELGVEFVPYPIPSVEEVDGVAHSIATMDFGGVSKATKHPREAYELLKFMGWGVEGWKARLEIYHDETIVNAAGDPLIRDSVPVPITLDEKVWESYKEIYYTGGENDAYWDEYFSKCTGGIPFGWTSIPGYWDFCDQYFNKIGIHGLVDTGKNKASDFVDEATEMANQYYADAMKKYFNMTIEN